MATQTQYTCDVCGKPKGQANHRYALVITKEAMTVWQWWQCRQPGALHICGEACLLKKISERLGRESFALPEPSAETIGGVRRRLSESVDDAIATIHRELSR